MSLYKTICATTAPERRLVATYLLIQLANQATYFVGFLGYATYELAMGTYAVALLALVMNVSMSAGNLVAGVVVDRIGPRRTLVTSIGAYLLAGILAYVLVGSYVGLVVAGALCGASLGVTSTSIISFPPFIVSGTEALKRANSLVDASVNVSIIIGPAIGGALAAVVGARSVFVFASLSLACALAMAWGMRAIYEPQRRARPGRAAVVPLTDFADGVRVTFATRDLRLLFISGFLGFFAFGAFDALESLFYRDTLRVGIEWMGWLSTIMGVGCVAGSLALLRLPARRVGLGLLTSMLALTGIGAMLYTGTNLLLFAALGQVITGFGFGLLSPVQHLLIQQLSPLSHVGRVTSVMHLGMNGAGTLPLLVAPILADALGVQAVLFGASAFVAVVGLAMRLWLRGGRGAVGGGRADVGYGECAGGGGRTGGCDGHGVGGGRADGRVR